MNQRQTLTAALLSTVLLASGAAYAQNTPAQPANQERCFGVAMKGEAVCVEGATEPCQSVAASDHPGDAYKLVPKSTCEQTPSTTSPTHFGQLQPYPSAAPADAQAPAGAMAPQPNKGQ